MGSCGPESYGKNPGHIAQARSIEQQAMHPAGRCFFLAVSWAREPRCSIAARKSDDRGSGDVAKAVAGCDPAVISRHARLSPARSGDGLVLQHVPVARELSS
jgi:hypothetical protein